MAKDVCKDKNGSTKEWPNLFRSERHYQILYDKD